MQTIIELHDLFNPFQNGTFYSEKVNNYKKLSSVHRHVLGNELSQLI